MKLPRYKCDRCGKKFNEKIELIQGVSDRCVEMTWDICSECLEQFHTWMRMLK